MRIFLAGSGKDRHLISILIASLRSMGYAVYDWTADPGWENPDKADPADIALRDLEKLKISSGLIWLVHGTSEGASFEAGYAMALDIPVVVLKGPDFEIPKGRIYAKLLEKKAVASNLVEAVLTLEGAQVKRK